MPDTPVPNDQRPATWEDLVRHEAQKQNFSPVLALEVMRAESSGDPNALGRTVRTKAGEERATGLFQLLPSTAKQLGVDPSDPIQNVRGGITLLKQLRELHNGDVRTMLLA